MQGCRVRRVMFAVVAACVAAVAGGAGGTAQAGAVTADLAITKTDGTFFITAGAWTTYTITASNAGPSGTNAVVADLFPAAITGTWTCLGAGGGTCLPSGVGSIVDTVSLPAGASVTYSVLVRVDPAASGTLVNTATVTTQGADDPNPGNNAATDTDVIDRDVRVSISKTDGITEMAAGSTTIYSIVGRNLGVSSALDVVIVDAFPPEFTSVSWTCTATGGATCTAAGTGMINDTVSMPPAGQVAYVATATLSPSATGTVTNVASIQPPNLLAATASDVNAITEPPASTSTSTTVEATTTTVIDTTTSSTTIADTTTTIGATTTVGATTTTTVADPTTTASATTTTSTTATIATTTTALAGGVPGPATTLATRLPDTGTSGRGFWLAALLVAIGAGVTTLVRRAPSA